MNNIPEQEDQFQDLSAKDKAIAALASLTDEQQLQVQEVIEKYRQRMLADRLKEIERQKLPNSFYTKKGPGRGKNRRK